IYLTNLQFDRGIISHSPAGRLVWVGMTVHSKKLQPTAQNLASLLQASQKVCWTPGLAEPKTASKS
uniref:Uncharacterized protein n=1 Tax=Apteryx owenii TaxID=8824 RepID=A0A8B9NWL4_APTOW